MTDIEQLEHELQHASAIAACAIGQPDRAEAVKHREYVQGRLEEAKRAAAVGVSGTRGKEEQP